MLLDVQLWELGSQRLHQGLSETILMNTLTDVKEFKKDSDWGKFRQHRQQVHKLLRSAHWNYLSEFIGPKLSDNPKPFFRYIKKIKRDPFGIQGLRDEGQIVA